jgi:hypothetical protein
MRKEDNSPQGKIVTELLQHLHSCKNNCDVFYGRKEELVRLKEYITGPSTKVGHGGGGQMEIARKLFTQSPWQPPMHISCVAFYAPILSNATVVPFAKRSITALKLGPAEVRFLY